MSISMMECRYSTLIQAVSGYLKTKVVLILDNGTNLYPAFTSDDIGMYCIIPKIAYYFGLPLDSAIRYFFNGLLIFSFTIGIIGFLLLFRSWIPRIVSFIGLSMLEKVVAEPMDIYRIAATVVVGTIPLFLYFITKNYKSRWFLPFLVFSGLYAGVAHYVRLHSGTPILLFIFILIITQARLTIIYRTKLLGALALGFFISASYFRHEWNMHSQYVQRHFPSSKIDQGAHIFWHPIYLGFGFIHNDHDISYNDRVADLKVQSIKPGTPYPSQESEMILKSEVIKLIKKDYFFVLRVIGAKLGVLLMLFLLFANFGIIAAYFFPKDFTLEIAFIAALGFSSIPGILTIPHHMYLLGFIALATIYGILGIGLAFEKKLFSTLMAKMKKFFKRAEKIFK